MTKDEAIQLAFARQQAGNPAEAEAICRQILAMDPNYSDAYRLLCVLANKAGQPLVGVEMMRKAVAIAPGRAEYQFDLGHMLASVGQIDEAIVALRQAVALRPDWALAHIKLGNELYGKGLGDEAIASFRQAIFLQPDAAEAHNNLGSALCAKQRWEEGIAAFERALAIRPEWAEARHNLGNALYASGKIDAAIAEYQRTLSGKPDYAEAIFSLANAYQIQGKLDEAVVQFRRALAVREEWPQAHNGLGLTRMWRGEIAAAVGCFERALQIAPRDVVADSNRLFALHFHAEYDAPSILREARVWEARHTAALGGSTVQHRHDRLRVGYVSPDFREHCQGLFTVPLLSNHDHGEFEIYCYSSVANPDAVTGRLRGYADVWREAGALNDEGLAKLIRADEIDVLVDLTMHMARGRLLAFARKPAAVQIAWLAYPGTTGLSALDARLTDPYLDPVGIGDHCYAEKSIRLPETFWCYDALALGDAEGLNVNPLPAERNGYVTFGCLNNFCKINRGLLALWSRVFHEVPGSRLLMLAPLGRAREWVIEQFGSLGIEAGRVGFVGQQRRAAYLAEYHRIDLGLDTLPYNGHTTSLDSMWMGVPVVSRVGRTVVGRAGFSQLSNLGMTELVARDDEAFVKIAAELAGDLRRLAELRRTLRGRMIESPLMDAARFARNIEAVYREMGIAG